VGALAGRIAVITGAGRGIGREHALLFAKEGAKVLVNDAGVGPDGSGHDGGPAHEVVEEIRAAGGEAIANTDDVSTSEGAENMVNGAIEAFGALDVVVNNAGILRDRMLVNMTDEEWDDVIRVHLRGHFVMTRAAARYWRNEAKAGSPRQASVINTSSTSGLFSTPGQTNYGAAKTGIATFTEIVQRELERYGVRCNAIAPVAATRLIATIPGREDAEAPKPVQMLASGAFDDGNPANISPFVAYLATANCRIGGRVFWVRGGEVGLFQPFSLVDLIASDHRWTIEELEKSAAHFADLEFNQVRPY
jgi:NAD(P)-dependent dehydrogenase (short-subunit alcohol dehydrogenase family)